MLRAVLIAFLLCSAGQASWISGRTCAKVLRASEHYVIEESLKEELGKVPALFANGEDPKAAAKNAFELVLEARLKLLPEETAREVRRQIEKRKASINRDEIGGHSDSDGVAFWGPTETHGTIVHYAILLHEIEHVIQNELLLREAPEPFLRTFGARPLNLIWEKEQGAVRTEWAYLKAIPKEAKEDLLRNFNDANLLQMLMGGTLTESMLTHSNGTFEEYVAAQKKELGLQSNMRGNSYFSMWLNHYLGL